MPSSSGKDRYQTALVAPSSRTRTSSVAPYGAGRYEHQRYLSEDSQRASSEPLMRGRSDAAYMARTGFPRPAFGEVMPSAGSASAPLRGTQGKHDYFRETYSRTPASAREHAPFTQLYDSYKAQDDDGMKQYDGYRTYAASAPKLSKEQRRDDSYRGDPRASKEWHAEAERRARASASTLDLSTKGRAEMASTYVAYEGKDDRGGHLKRISDHKKRIEKLGGNAGRHHGYFK